MVCLKTSRTNGNVKNTEVTNVCVYVNVMFAARVRVCVLVCVRVLVRSMCESELLFDLQAYGK